MAMTSRCTALMAALFMTVTVAAQSAQTTQKASPAPLVGKWEGVRQGGEAGETETVTLIFDVKGASFTGTMLRQGHEYGKIADGKIDGAKITWTVRDIDFSGDITGTSMHVIVHFGNGPIEFDVKKQDKV